LSHALFYSVIFAALYVNNFRMSRFLLLLYHGMYLLKLIPAALASLFFTAVKDVVFVLESRRLDAVIRFVKGHFLCEGAHFIDITATDRLRRCGRFRLIYIIAAARYNITYNFITYVKKDILSISRIFQAASWAEREVWDLFGVCFLQHHDLRRLLTDYGFVGHPLRKDFPVTGFVELFYNERLGVVKYKKVSLAQELRNFTQKNPWGVFPPRGRAV
jgi:NADH-quinone oxidoreductase subunit C